MSFARVLCKVKNQTFLHTLTQQTVSEIDFGSTQNTFWYSTTKCLSSESLKICQEKIILKCKSFGLKPITPSLCLLSFVFGSSIIYFVSPLIAFATLFCDYALSIGKRFKREMRFEYIASISSLFKLLMRKVLSSFGGIWLILVLTLRCFASY